MPYFIQKQGDKHCVMKGTKEEPGETVKCHPTHKEALDHLRALYVHVEDAKATASDAIANAPHGEGGTLANVPGEDDDKDCVCPNGHKVKSEEGTPCSERDCPQCGAKMGRAVGKELGGLTVYKSGDKWRWLAVSNVAVEDREHEIVSEKAYDDAIAYAYKNNAFGELDLVHVNGTDAGPSDLMVRLGKRLMQGGEWFDDSRSARARVKVKARPDHWGVSIKFKYDPEQFDGKVYKGGIRILKCTILPRQMAASYGTAIAVHGGDTMKRIDEETIAALKELDMTDEEIAALVEKQKALPAEEFVKVKEEETETKTESDGKSIDAMSEAIEVRTPVGFFDMIKAEVQKVVDSFKKTPEPEQPTADVGENSTAEPEVESEKEVAQESETKSEPEEEKQFVTKELLQAYGKELAQTIVAAIVKEVAELKLKQDKAEEKAKKQEATINKQLAELAKPVEQRVMDRLAELPPIVKTRVSHLDATAKSETLVATSKETTYLGKLMESIEAEVKRGQKGDGKVVV